MTYSRPDEIAPSSFLQSEAVTAFWTGIARQNKLNKKTIEQYRQCSESEKTVLQQWLHAHYATIPLPKKLKEAGFSKLQRNDPSSPAALFLIRQALNMLKGK